MAKRFTDTSKWNKQFLRTMKAPYKLLWLYILDECNHAGIWDIDFDVAQLKIGEKLNKAEAHIAFNGQILEFDNKWFIFNFIEFQYGELNPTNRVHYSIINILNKYNIDWQNKPLTSPLQGAMDKDKDKEQDKDKDKEHKKSEFNLEFVSPDLILTYQDFLKMRVSIKKPFRSQLSIEANYKQLLKLSNNNIESAKEIIEQSIANQWQGFFEIKQTPKKNDYTKKTTAGGFGAL